VRPKRLRSAINRTLTSSYGVASPQLQRAQFSIAFILHGSTHADQGDTSGNTTRFSTANTALRAVKEAVERDESLCEFSRQCQVPSYKERSSPFRLSCLEAPTQPGQGDISGQSTRFSTANTALRAVKEAVERDKSHVDFTRQCAKSPVATSAVLHCVYLAWKHPHRQIEVIFQVSRPAFPPRTRPCVRSKRLWSSMNRTLTLSNGVASTQLQRAQFSIAFILPGSTHAARSR